ncbi:MAG TPA: chitobiase/beta-hexosaminidase C-terminal domain-containing protein [Candidatus Acidoferrales bacterium]
MPSFCRSEKTGAWRERGTAAGVALAFLLGVVLLAPGSFAQTPILTQHYDNGRTGQNTTEVLLNTTNVNSTTFGKLFSIPVDGYVYAQPLYKPGVSIGGVAHNVVYVATEHDSVYAFDADNGGVPLWQVSLILNSGSTVPSGNVSSGDIVPEIGITGTPVIDPMSNTLYVVAKTLESGKYYLRLHALDITTGAEKFGGPVVMAATVTGTGNGSSGGKLTFSPQWENQRPGLLLQNGFVYVGFAAHGDNGPWHGWILSYNAGTLAAAGAWCASPNGGGSGFWAAGAGLAADSVGAGRIFVATGNGDFPVSGNVVPNPAPAPSTSVDFGDSIVQLTLSATGSITPTDYFTPYNTASLDGSDTDLGSGGVLIPPMQSGTYPDVLIQTGKQGRIYMVNRDALTKDGSHYCNGCSSDPEVIGTLDGVGGLWSVPAYWNGNVYFAGTSDHLKSYTLTNGLLSQSPTSESAETIGYPGASPVISANGTTNGIAWVAETHAYTSNGPAVLRAFDATNVSSLLYASDLAGDTMGPSVKFVVPVVTNGKVYVGTQKEVDVFGLFNGETRAASPTFSPAGGSYATAVQVMLADATANSTIYYTTDGTAPSTASAVYSAPITVSSPTTITAIATATGYIQSTPATATYTISTQTAAPAFSPAPGTYASAQSISIIDAGATIYYTTDGSTPNHNSAQFSAPIPVTTTTTINAIASAPGFTDSPMSSGIYTINPNATTSINFGLGFSTPTGMQFNGSTDLDDSRLQLTNGSVNEAGSAFFTTAMDIRNFTTDFTFQISTEGAGADGFTFTIQNSTAGPTALGPIGAGLGYGAGTPGGTPGIGNSIAVKFDIFNNDGEGSDSTGLYTNGASPTIPATSISSSGIIFYEGDSISTHITYDGTTLTMTLTDNVINKTYSQSWAINIPATVGGNMAYVGFTGGSGGLTASQKIESWTFVSTPPGSGTTGTAIQYETENLLASSVSSGPAYRAFAWAGFSNGNGTTLDSTKVGDNVAITLNVPTAGVYDVKYAVKIHNSRGIGQLAVNGANLGAPVDQYGAEDSWQEFDLGNVPLTAGNQVFTFTVTGKDAASTGYSLSWDYIKLTPVNAPIQYETESLLGSSVSSGPTYRAFAWTGFVNGNGTTLDSTKIGDSVAITLNVPVAGNYDVKYAAKIHNSRGSSQLTVNGTNLGTPVDQYAAVDAWQEFDVGTIALGAGNQVFTFRVTGKDAASTGYSLSWDYIKLTPQ